MDVAQIVCLNGGTSRTYLWILSGISYTDIFVFETQVIPWITTQNIATTAVDVAITSENEIEFEFENLDINILNESNINNNNKNLDCHYYYYYYYY